MKNYSLKLLLALFSLFISWQAEAGITTRSEKISGSGITIGAYVEVHDELYDYMLSTASTSWGFTDASVLNNIRLKYTGANKTYYATPWSISVSVNIRKYYNTGTALPVVPAVLTINYDPTSGISYNDINTFQTGAGYFTRVEVTGVTLSSNLSSMPSDVILENELYIERYYNLNTSTNLGIIATPNATDNTIQFTWGFTEGAEEFDLEWLYVYDLAVPGKTITMDWRNATRITTTDNYYKINAVFDEGNLYYRVRAVGKLSAPSDPLNFVYRKEANWSQGATNLTLNDFQNPSSGTVSSITYKNWTYSAVYAEEGKRKEVTTFFDGSSRNRQSITINNSDNISLIQEQMYDYEGRSSLQTLPAPNINGATYDHLLNFYPKFSQNASSKSYNKQDYDNFIIPCTSSCANANLMTNTAGASEYFSSTNSVAVAFGFNDFIPNAQQYPFTHSTYDLENRVSSISGVGPTLKTSSGHETKFYEANASQEKLDRLFGNEVGYASHYREKVTVDPNGQISVNFINNAGKVIATALRGNSPSNLTGIVASTAIGDQKEPYLNSEFIAENFSGLNQFDPAKQCNTITKDFMVTSPGSTYNFYYNITPQTFASLCDPTSFPCQYTLLITISDECGNPVVDDNNLVVGVPITINPTSTNYPITFSVSHFPTIGVYKIVKTLCLDQQYQQTEYNQFLSYVSNPNGSACVPSLSTLESTDEALVDASECQTCSTYVAAACSTYVNSTLGISSTDPNFASAYNLQFPILYQQNCVYQVQKTCDGLLDNINSDLSPSGQYFEYVIAPNTHYIDALISANALTLTQFNSYITANSCVPYSSTFDYTGLEANWDPCYAGFFAPYHPEYCRYMRCVALNCSDNYSYLLESLDYPNAAITDAVGNVAATSGFPVILDVSSLTGSNPAISVLNNDPYYNSSVAALSCTSPANLPADYNYMAGQIANCTICASSYPSGGYSIAGCTPPGSSMWSYAACIPVNTSGITPASAQLNQQWINFMMLYQTIKSQQINSNSAFCPPLKDNTYPPNGMTSGYASSGTSASQNVTVGSSNITANIIDINNVNIIDADPVSSISALENSAIGNSTHPATPTGTPSDPDPTNDCSQPAKITLSYDEIYTCLSAQSTFPNNLIFSNGSIYNAGTDAITVLANNIPGAGSVPIRISNGGSSATHAPATDVNLGYITPYSSDVPFPTTPNATNLAQSDQLGFLTLLAISINNATSATAPYFTASVDPINQVLVITPDPITALAITQAYQAGTSPASISFSICVTSATSCGGSSAREDGSDTNIVDIGPTVHTCCNICTFNISPAYNLCQSCACTIISQEATQFLINNPSYTPADIAPSGADFSSFVAFVQTNLTTALTPPTGCNSTSFSHVITALVNQCSTNPSFVLDQSYANQHDFCGPFICPGSGDPPCSLLQGTQEADLAAQNDFNTQVTQLAQNFENQFSSSCLNNINEIFEVNYSEMEYHYTLYYYDQAGNLTRTVPPMAVQRIPCSTMYGSCSSAIAVNSIVQVARLANSGFKLPGHARNKQTWGTVINSLASGVPSFATVNNMVTDYFYSTLEQVVGQFTPDGGLGPNYTQFWYDILGRLRFSQNSKQSALGGICIGCFGNYSYTLYDAQSRIIEVGENNQNGIVCTLQNNNNTPVNSGRYSSPGNIPPFILGSSGNNTTSSSCPAGYSSQAVPFYWFVNTQNFPTQNGGQVTKTFYDYSIPNNLYQSEFTISHIQENLRKRVSSSTYSDVENSNLLIYDHATHYSYDVHGNVEELIQENPDLVGMGQSFKDMTYDYDLISGKVNYVDYQAGNPDQFYHHYYYDADNRITNVFTSNDNLHWDQDARYFYYPHGPLARVELGDEKVQGMDYAYTLQGWIKGVNDNTLNSLSDIGLDGITPTSTGRQYIPAQINMHQNVANDVMGYVLDYFTDNTSISSTDYVSVGSHDFTGGIKAAPFYASAASSPVYNLYNGNIKGMSYGINFPSSLPTTSNVNARVFNYDQLNRIVQSTNYYIGSGGYSAATAVSSPSSSDYYEAFSYDPNGNILTAKRNAYTVSGGNSLDQLTYGMQYPYYNNMLDNASDGISGSTFTGDIKPGQTSGNYGYDPIGNLVYDTQEEIDNIDWSVYGKIKAITRSSASTKSNLTFKYDAQGNRISKTSRRNNAGPHNIPANTYYIRDAQGNVMAVYTTYVGANDLLNLYLTEQHVYGSSRVAIKGCNINMQFPPAATASLMRTLGTKSFELSNHLGNVLEVVNDKKLPHHTGTSTNVDYYQSDILSTTDYYAFGAPMPGRQYTSTNYRYGFNGKENDPETVSTGEGTQDYGMRIYNPSLGRFFSVDPLFKEYAYKTPYDFAENKPIIGSDLDGEELQIDIMGREHRGPIDLTPINEALIREHPELAQKTALNNPLIPRKGDNSGLTISGSLGAVVSSVQGVNKEFVKSYQTTRTNKINVRSKGGTKINGQLNGNGGSNKFLGNVGNLIYVGIGVYDAVKYASAETPEKREEAKNEAKRDGGEIAISIILSELINPVFGLTTTGYDYYSENPEFIMNQYNMYRVRASSDKATDVDRKNLSNYEEKHLDVIHGNEPKKETSVGPAPVNTEGK
jgi:RHS repeat-associated protein